jgi:hypothetical protein
MRKRRLPLDSPNWTPLTEVHRFLCEQTGNRSFAAQDLTDAMANDRVQSMRRQVYRPLRRLHDDEPECELLLPSFWATKYLLDSSATELQLVERRGHRLPLPPPRNSVVPGPNFKSIPLSSSGYVFYAWKPDWKKIWVADSPSTEARPPVPEVSVERGRKKVYDRPALTVIAFALFEHRKQGEPEKTQAKVAGELRAWCKEQKEKVPGNTTLNEIASAAFQVRKKWKASLKR